MNTKLPHINTVDMHLETCTRMKLQTLYDVRTSPYLETYKVQEHAGRYGAEADVEVTSD